VTDTVVSTAPDEPTAEQLAEIEKKYEEGSATREVTPVAGHVLKVVALAFAFYHYFTAGFGLPADHWHMGWHLCGLFILTYAFFPVFKTKGLFGLKTGRGRIGNIPFYDIVLMILGVAASLYVGMAWRGIPLLGIEEQTFRMGNPNQYDVFFGVVLIILVLDLARRTLGWVLPLIICVFMSYALFLLCIFRRRVYSVSRYGLYLPLCFILYCSVLSRSVPVWGNSL